MNSDTILNGGIKNATPHPSQKTINKTFVRIADLYLCTYMPIVFILTNMELPLLEALSLISVFLGIVGYYNTVGAFRPVLTYCIFTFICFLYGLPIAGLFTAFITPSVTIPYLIVCDSSRKNKIITLMIPVVGFLLSLLVVRSPIFAAISLLPLPVSISFAHSISKNNSRVSSICRASFALLLIPVASATAYYLVRYGFTTAPLAEAVEGMKLSLVDETVKLFEIAYDQYADITPADARAIVEEAVYSVSVLLPAIVIVTTNVLSFSLHAMIANIFIRRHPEDKERLRSLVVFNMSLISAIVFIVMMCLTTVSANETEYPISLTASNILLILVPAMFYTALMLFRVFTLSKKGACLGSLVYFLLIAIVFIQPMLALQIAPTVIILASVSGAAIIIINSVMLKIKSSKQNKN